MNKAILKLIGTPHNLSTGTGGRSTEAQKRATVNSSVVSNYFLSGHSGYGTKGVSATKS